MSDLRDSIDRVRYCPSSIGRVVFEDLRRRRGENYVPADVTSPYMHCMETACTLASSAMIRNDANNRKQYAKIAETEDEIYLHMSDKDYLGRFGAPGQAPLYVCIPYDSLIANAKLDEKTGIRKAVIGRHTMWQIAGIYLSINYPIEIRILPSGNIQVIADGTIPSPIEALGTNLVPYKLNEIGEYKYIEIKLNVYQYKRDTYIENLVSGTGFTRMYNVPDNFYYCRVYNRVGEGNPWHEINTIHTEELYSGEPTAILRRYKGKLKVSFPQIYFTEGKLRGEIRIDILSTRGDFNLSLAEYKHSEFGVRWDDLDDRHNGYYSSIMPLMTDVWMYSDGSVSGGSNEMTFKELQEKVVMGVDSEPVAVGPLELEHQVKEKGFDVLLATDTATNREFLVSKHLPRPENHNTRTPIGSSLELIQVSHETLKSLAGVNSDESTMTILAKTIWEKVNGRLVPMSDIALEKLMEMSADDRVVYLNNKEVYYNPFQYSLNTNERTFDVRPHYADAPKIISRRFLEENTLTTHQCSTSTIHVKRNGSGYVIQVIAKVSDSAVALGSGNVGLQIGVRPVQESRQIYTRASVMGMTKSKEIVFEAYICTDFLYDTKDNLVVNSLEMFEGDILGHHIAGVSDLNLYYFANDEYMVSTDIDKMMGDFQLSETEHGITHEVVTVRFIEHLESLRCRSRRIPGDVLYRRYEEDVHAVWDRDYPFRKPDGSAVIDIIDGKPTIRIEFHKGDVILNEDGSKKIQHKKGTVMLDEGGSPIPVSMPDPLYQFEMAVLDAKYLFCTETAIKEYVEYIPGVIAGWVTEDIPKYQANLIELTYLYVTPPSSAGSTSISTADGDLQQIPSEQSIVVTAKVSKNTHENADLRSQITDTIKDIINQELSKKIVNIDDIQTLIKDQINEVHSVHIQGLGPNSNIYSLIVVGNGDALSIRKILVQEQSGATTIQDDISVGFVKLSL